MAEIRIPPIGMAGILDIPHDARGIVLFAHGSGSGRLSPRNGYVARGLRDAGLGTLLMDLLLPEEERDRRNVFDIGLLASRLARATEWVQGDARTKDLAVGYFGASTGAAAALAAAAAPHARIDAVVSRGGRPDLAGPLLAAVRAPVLLIVGSLDEQVLDLNCLALAQLSHEKRLAIVEGASHLFEEPGTLDQVIALAVEWFVPRLTGPRLAGGAPS